MQLILSCFVSLCSYSELSKSLFFQLNEWAEHTKQLNLPQSKRYHNKADQ